MQKTKEIDSRIIVIPPASETLLYSSLYHYPWPEMVKNDYELEYQVKKRLNLIALLDSLFALFPRANTEITELIDAGIIEVDYAAKIYEQLTIFFEEEEHNNRMLLYLPFELIPAKTWQTESEKLTKVISRFLDVYLRIWKKLLYVHDVRASFVDGDIPEIELRASYPLLRVSKVAHFVPVLVQKGLISCSQVIQMIKEAPDETLKNSLVDTLLVLFDLKLISQDDLSNVYSTLDSNWSKLNVKPPMTIHLDAFQLRNTQSMLELIQQIKMDLVEISNNHLVWLTQFPKTRANWKRQKDQMRVIERCSSVITAAIIQQVISVNNLEEFILADQDPVFKLISIRSIEQAIEKLAVINLKQAQATLSVFKTVLNQLRSSQIDAVQVALERTWLRLTSLKIIDQVYLNNLGYKLPELEVPFSNREMSEEPTFKKLLEITEIIKTDSELNKFLYPIVIMYGSKIKGYGSYSTDFDVAVFVKPDTVVDSRDRIQKLLTKVFVKAGIQGSALEFWLKRNGSNLQIIDFCNQDRFLGDSSLVHVLFSGVWCSSANVIEWIYEKLLSEYLYSEDSSIRKTWLEEVERNVLQYRLLHRGYAHIYSEQGGIQTKHSENIDSNSSFWDSGYRQLATKLFLKKVFLPQLKR